MLGSISTIFFYSSAILLFILTGFYLWRRLHSLENYTLILEKKINNLKKEKKELQELIKDSEDKTTFDEADIVMNELFNIDKCCVDKCTIKEVEKETETIESICMNDTPEEVEIVESKLPIVEHITSVSTPDVDIESVISDSNVYNKKKLAKMNLEKLKEICNEMKLSTDGNKNALIDRILS